MDKESPGNATLDQSLRSIAILLHTLPSRTHRALIGQLDVEAKQKVARELESIGEIDVMEQHRVLSMMLDQLHSETDRVKKVESEIQDEIFIGRARVAKKPNASLASTLLSDSEPTATKETPVAAESESLSPTQAGSSQAGSNSLDFLVEMQLNDAALLLANETAQTIAIALSSIPQHTASILLPKMPGHLQEEVVFRIEQMDTVPPQIVAETAQHLKRQTTPPDAAQLATLSTPQSVSSIPVSESGAMIYQFPRYTKNAIVEPTLQTQTSYDQASGLAQQFSQQPSLAAPAQDSPASALSVPSSAKQTTPQQQAEDEAAKTDKTLLDVPPQTLCRALGYATTRQAFLVLCGLPNEHAELILGLLPKRKARKVQADMRRMGKLHLSEIDEAKKAVAEIAVRIALGEHETQQRTAVA